MIHFKVPFADVLTNLLLLVAPYLFGMFAVHHDAGKIF